MEIAVACSITGLFGLMLGLAFSRHKHEWPCHDCVALMEDAYAKGIEHVSTMRHDVQRAPDARR